MFKNGRVRVFAVLIVTVILILFAFGSSTTIAATYKAGKAEEKLAVDGVDKGYTAEALSVGKGSVKMAVWQDRVFVLVSMKGSGWIAVAFNKQGKGMDGSNMVIGYVDATGKAAVRNDLGKGWSHSAAAKQAVIEHAVLQADGITYFEFAYPLAFAEGFALKSLEEGSIYSVVVAGNERSFSITSKHTWAAKADFSL